MSTEYEPLPGTPQPLLDLIGQLEQLPGIGRRSSVAIANAIARDDSGAPERLAEAVRDARRDAQFCRICHGLTDRPSCAICTDESRTAYQICVVSTSSDSAAIERLGTYRGRYHVLHGLLDPLNGVTPDRLTITSLLKRIQPLAADPMAEIIMALPATLEGNITADYILQTVKGSEHMLTMTWLRRGLAHRSRLEFATPETLAAAMNNRQSLDSEPVPADS